MSASTDDFPQAAEKTIADNLREREVSDHFAFGENWRNYSKLIDESRIRSAAGELKRLLGVETLEGKSFLDIGCGSGLHSLAALRLGAAEVVGIDIDPISIATTSSVIQRFAPDSRFSAFNKSVFEIDTLGHRTFDYVYSWGVLHHTGAMWEAIACATRAVNESGYLALALYRKTPFCRFWRLEKRLYKSSPVRLQKLVGRGYSAATTAVRVFVDREIATPRRGMDYWIDLHDWLGGYPYESVARHDLIQFLESRNFSLKHEFLRPQEHFVDRFVTGCDEWLFERVG